MEPLAGIISPPEGQLQKMLATPNQAIMPALSM